MNQGTEELGEVINIDIASKTVTSWTPSSTLETSYESPIVAAGSTASSVGNDHVAEHAPGLKSLDDAPEPHSILGGQGALRPDRGRDDQGPVFDGHRHLRGGSRAGSAAFHVLVAPRVCACCLVHQGRPSALVPRQHPVPLVTHIRANRELQEGYHT